MSYLKKYVHFLFVIVLCFHSLSLMSGEWGYIPVYEETVVEAGGGLSSMVAENSQMLGIAAVTVVLGSGLIAGREAISSWAQNKCNSLETNIKKECNEQLKKIEESSLKNRLLLGAVKPMAGGAVRYFKYNKWHAVVAALCAAVGNRFFIFPFSAVPHGVGMFTFLSGWFGQGFAEMNERFGTVDDAIEKSRAENEKLHKKAEEKLDNIETDLKSLSGQLATTKTEIKEQIGGLDIKVSRKIETVGQNLIDLDAKLKDIPQQILQLTGDLKVAQGDLQKIQGSNETIIEQNKAMVTQTQALSDQLTNATQEFISTKKDFDTLGQTLTTQVKELAQDTQKQVGIVQDVAGKQTEEIQLLKSNVTSNFNKLFEDVIASNKLLCSFENIQKSQGEQLTALFTKINAAEEHDATILAAMNAIAQAQEASTVNYTKIVTSLNDIRVANTQSMEMVCTRMASLDDKLAKTDGKVNDIQKQYDELKKMFEAQTGQILQLSLQNGELQQQVSGLHKKMDENNRLAEETNAIAKKAVNHRLVQKLPVTSGPWVSVEDDDAYPKKQAGHDSSSSWNRKKTPRLPINPPAQPSSHKNLLLTGAPSGSK